MCELALDPFQCAWIPPGSLVFEETFAGSINYAIRVPLLPLTKSSVAEYAKYIEACKADESLGIKHMIEIGSYLKDAVAKRSRSLFRSSSIVASAVD